MTRAALILALAVVAAPGCDASKKDAPRAPRPAAPGPSPKAGSSAKAGPSPKAGPPSGPAPAPAAASGAPTSDGANAGPVPEKTTTATVLDDGPWLASRPTPVAPAAPAAAVPDGVLLVDKKDGLRKLSLSGGLASPSFEVSDADRETFYPFMPGPLVLGEHAYWASTKKVVRRPLAGGPLETLASDALAGTRLTGPHGVFGKLPARLPVPVVGYIGKDGDDIVAKVWAPGSGAVRITPEGSEARSVAFGRTTTGLVVVSLEGRTSMSPVHARTLEVTAGGVKLGEDAVVWVAGPSHRLSELEAVGLKDGSVETLLPIQQDTHHFGLAQVELGATPKRADHVTWEMFPDGQDPSPVVAAEVCGDTVAVYTRPTRVGPTSPQELRISRLKKGQLADTQRLVRQQRFINVSVAPTKGGAVVVYVADRQTHAMTLRCKR